MAEQANPQPVPQPTPEPSPITEVKQSNFKFYSALVVILVVSFIAYTYFNKFKETKIDLTKVQASLTTETSNEKELRKEFDTYRSQAESKTSWVKRPFILNGKLVTDGKGNAVYTVAYFKDAHKITDSGKSIVDELSKTVTVTQAVTITTHEKIDKQEGQRINGLAYVALPAGVFTGDLSRLGLGWDHNFIFGTEIGLEGGTKSINSDPLKNMYLDLHLGVGTPF